MSSASLAVSRRAHPDPARIAAMAAAMALNLAVIVIATRPITPAQLQAVRQLAPPALIRLIQPRPEPPPPPPVAMKPLLHPPVLPLAHPRPLPVTPPVTIASVAMPDVTPAPVTPTIAPPDVSTPGTGTGTPVEASLAYRSAPLSFPPQALRQRMHGTVMLRVLVDPTGKPIDVVIEQGSGYALLDRSARQQVLAGWRFQPALVDGKAVRAWARVPVTFDLRQ